MSHQILPIILFFIMFSMGLAITLQDFKNVAKYPKAFMIGALLQLVSLPMFAFAFAYLGMASFGISSAIAVGLVIIAACPGGVTSNLLTHLGKGDTALSISLTSVISLLSVITIPLIVNMGLTTFAGADEAASLNVLATTIGIFVITVVPVSLGMVVKAYKSDLADKMEPWARNIATVLFGLIVVAVVSKNSGFFVRESGLIPLIILFNAVTMAFAHYVSRAAKLKKAQATAITFECGLQNGTMAILIALNFLGNEMMMIPGALYSIVMFFTSGVYLYLMQGFRRKKSEESVEAVQQVAS